MIEAPKVVDYEGHPAAVIRLLTPRDEISDQMEPAIGEVLTVLAEEGVSPAGPLFTHHLIQSNDIFDVEVGFPVGRPFEESGRVHRSRLPRGKMAHSSFVGPYEDLFSALNIRFPPFPGKCAWQNVVEERP